MKTKKSERTLALKKNTIVTLNNVQLGKVGGGEPDPEIEHAWPWLTEVDLSYCPDSCDTCGCPTDIITCNS